MSNNINFSSIVDNKKRGSVGKFLEDNITENSHLLIVSAYFTIYAYEKLKNNLNSIENLKFLFGEPTFIQAVDPKKVNRRNFKIEDDKVIIPIENQMMQKAIAEECAKWIEEKVEIKSMVKPNFLHGKMYHITQQNGVQKAITGSSNFTVNGLGFGGSPNIELNMVVDSDRDRQDLKQWFEELWNDNSGMVEDVKQQVLKYLNNFYLENEPQFIYFKTLFHIFEKYIDEQANDSLFKEQTGFFETEIWNMLYEFQKDGVKAAINKILKHNGCIIADSVGLGKTFEALAVIKYFELLNYRVLVLCPKKLSNNWTIYQANQNNMLNPFKKDKFGYTVLYHTDLCRTTGASRANGIELENFNWSAYDLVVIDESHNFKGNPVERVNDNGIIKMNRAKWLMEKIIKSGGKTRVLMLSATPVNNDLRDLRNQIALITAGENDALAKTTGIKDITATIKNAQIQFSNWISEKNTDKKQSLLLQKLGADFIKLLDELTIARSRKHIKNFYEDANNKEKICKFPQRLKPIAVFTQLHTDNKQNIYTYEKINETILEYKLSLFNPSAYVKDDKKSEYENITELKSGAKFTQKDRENYLIGMMKVNFLKRLESSVESFEISMHRTINRIDDLINKINDFKKSTTQLDVDVEEYIEKVVNEYQEDEEADEDELERWLVGKKLKFNLKDLKLDEWLKDLKEDKKALNELYSFANSIEPDKDAKLQKLKYLIEKKTQQDNINPGNKKVIVFTAFVDTADYLYENLKDWVKEKLNLNIALVTGSYTKTTFGKNEYNHILTNFSPISKNRSNINSMPQTGEIDILIATDCISEGQNLQDCDYLVNYDIHWNPVRIIQRFGRIDRLGSKNEKIQMVNFWPTEDLDKYISLKKRVESRMMLVDITATADDNMLLDADDKNKIFETELKYREQQLKKLKEEVLDLEDMNESMSLTDFTLDDFRIELLNFINNNRERLEEAPMGLYAVVPSPSGNYSKLDDSNNFSSEEKEIIKPGVIFCLKHKNSDIKMEEYEKYNPLQPYFLVYVRDDKNVRLSYTNAKQILEIYRLLCVGKEKAYEELCELFNQETDNGRKMNNYSELLEKAVNNIKNVLDKQNYQKITEQRNPLLIPQNKKINGINDFELVTWLIIK